MMSTFLDGPAAGHEAKLVRCPMMLRVAVDPWNHVRTLEMVDDHASEPSDDELVHVYIAVAGTYATGMWEGRDQKTGRRTGGRFESCTYRLLPTQPDQEHLRQGKDWRAWCEANKERLRGDHHNGRPPEPRSPQAESQEAKA